MSTEHILRNWSAIPFRWGDGDCCQFAGAMVESITGKNPMQFFDYGNKLEALQMVYEFGSLDAAVSSVFGPSISVEESQSGDVILVNLPKRDAMVGVRYRDRLIVKTERGITDWPLKFGARAWSIR